MDTKALKDLYDEHNGITVMLEVLDAVLVRIRTSGAVDPADLERMAEFLTEFADKCHHGKEEAMLIPEMRKSPAASPELLARTVGEHKSGRDFIMGMKEALKGWKDGGMQSYHFAANARAYTGLLMEHIRMENVILFPMADRVLTAEQKTDLGKRFDEFEANVIGAGKHEQFHAMLSEMQRKYLSVKT